jgi:hypothetical protein
VKGDAEGLGNGFFRATLGPTKGSPEGYIGDAIALRDGRQEPELRLSDGS